ncbi:MAG TPA: aminopeptidase [Rikenellaceae bacterium]|nr:aminopeptidase [Rikenellaceae bacterium]
MKQIVVSVAVFLAAGLCANAQKAKVDFPEYQFTTVIENPITSVKNQYRSGTCWAYSAIGFVESEVIRINNITDPAKYPDFSEFFVVSHSYSDRADKYIMLDGNLTFSAGSQAEDVLDVIRLYGLVPQEEMTGMNYGTELPAQSELDAVLRAYVDAVVKNPNKTLTTAWKRGYQAILDEYLGKYPTEFTVDGVKYTPESYRDALKFNPDDYVTLTSFTHHPFYTYFPFEVADNWRWDEFYNVPIDEMMEILDYALENSYTIAWGAYVSEPGFTRDGLAILVDVKASNTNGSDQERWVGKADEKQAKSKAKKSAKLKTNPIVELVPTQQTRQTGFMNKTITDDHGMQIYGVAKDQWGGKYYLVKNSWGETGKYNGIWYASEAFVKGQTLDIAIHKSALPKEFVEKHPNILNK